MTSNSLHLDINRYHQTRSSLTIPKPSGIPYLSVTTIHLVTQPKNVEVTVTFYFFFTRDTTNFTYYVLFKSVSFVLLLLSWFRYSSAHVCIVSKTNFQLHLVQPIFQAAPSDPKCDKAIPLAKNGVLHDLYPSSPHTPALPGVLKSTMSSELQICANVLPYLQGKFPIFKSQFEKQIEFKGHLTPEAFPNISTPYTICFCASTSFLVPT